MKKKLLYCHLHNIDKVGKGIENKIHAQLKGFEEMGYEVSFLTLTKNVVRLDNKTKEIRKNVIYQRIFGPLKAVSLIKESNYDIMYIRGFGVDYALLYFLKKVKRNIKTIIFEFPTFPYDHELKGEGLVKQFYYYIDKLCSPNLKKHVHHSVNFDKLTSILGIPSTAISNAIDTQKIKVTGYNYEQLKEKKVNILGVASLRFYHGFDRVIKGLAEYYKTSKEIKVFFHIVGEGEPELSKLINLTNQLQLNKYVIFHGSKYDKELTKVFEIANVGIASLGMHRNGLEFGSVLKVREYFARGLPFLISYTDIHIQKFKDYFFKINPDDSPVEITDLLEWLYNKPIDAQNMRIIAEKEFKWKTQFNKIPCLKHENK